MSHYEHESVLKVSKYICTAKCKQLKPNLIINTFCNNKTLINYYNIDDHHYFNYTVSDTPTDLSLTRLGTGLLHVQLSWSGSSPRYEVFYSLSDSDNIQSLVNTTDTTYNVTSGLTQGQTYEFFVVSYGNDDTPVLPSVNSSIESVTLSK